MGSKTKKDVGCIVHKDGARFRVWAPFAESVAVTGSFNDWQETPLENEGDGYWYVDIDGAVAGQEYKYVIKNGDNIIHHNDPRALHFTTSAGNGVIVDTSFEWNDKDFRPASIEQQVIYELHVGTFHRPEPEINGTFDTVNDKLDYLRDLGITTLEIMPVCSMPQDRGWGYAPDYIYAVESLYGGRAGLQQLVDSAHQKGISVILDVVYNHFGPDEQYDLWQFDGWSKDGKGGIYFYNDWRSKTPWGDTRPDYGRPEVRQYILDNVRMWMIDCHIDGLRVDSTIFIRNAKGQNDAPDTDLPDGWSLLQDINRLANKIKPRALTIAEDVGVNDYITKQIEQGGAGFGAQWKLNFPHALRAVLTTAEPADINLQPICQELTAIYGSDPLQYVIYTDSHDSAANGSARLNEEIAPGKADNLFARHQELIAAAILLTAPGLPMLFQGQEFMQGGSFNDWQALDWHKAERCKGIVLAHKHLIALRKNNDGVSAGLTGSNVNLMLVDETNKVIAYHRWKNGGAGDDVVVIINFGNVQHDDYELWMPRDGTWTVRFNSTWRGYSDDFKEVDVATAEVADNHSKLIVPASCALILSQDA